MTTVNLLRAETHVSQRVDQIAAGEESEVVISRNGKPVARMLPIIQDKDVSHRIGTAEGEFTVTENIDGANEEVAKLFNRILATMRLLLDTQIALWGLTKNHHLSSQIR